MIQSSSPVPESTPAESLRKSEGAPKGRLWSYFDERLGLQGLVDFASKKTVPRHRHSVWYYLGGLSLFFFLVQCVTGVLLLLYYKPSGAEAYTSVRDITETVRFGWLIRSAHAWSANLMILVVFVHMFSVAFMKAYRKPRELGWWTGLILLGLTLGFGFTGYLLPMDQLAQLATQVGLETAAFFPGGAYFADLLKGGAGDNVKTSDTVSRFFTIHVAILPFLFFAVLGLHLWLVQRHGNALPPTESSKSASERRTVPFFPDFFLRDLAVWFVALNILGVCIALMPWELGPPPGTEISGHVHPEWFFMGQYQLLKVVPKSVGILGFLLGGALWALLPVFDRENASPGIKRFSTVFAALALAGLVIFTMWGYLAVWEWI